MPKTVFITGATGFVGSHVADYFFSQGYKVKCLARKTSNLSWLRNEYEIYEGSLSQISSLKKGVDEADLVVHVAGVVAAKNYDAYYDANVQGTINLAEACVATHTKKRFVLISSLTAVGPSSSFENPVDVESPMNPITAYGKSKKEAELAIWKFKDKLDISIVRPPAVYGPRDAAIFAVFQSVAKGVGLLIGFGRKNLSLVHVSDLARGIYLAGTTEKAIGKTYFISSDEFYNWDQLMNIIKNGFGKKSIVKLKLPHSIVKILGASSEIIGNMLGQTPVFNRDKAIDFIQENWTCSNRAAFEDLNYKQEVKIEEGIASTIKWYQENKWL